MHGAGQLTQPQATEVADSWDCVRMNPLREPLSPEQMVLLRVLFEPFDATGEWPVWQYADLTLDAKGIDAEAALESLPVTGDPGPMSRSYGLTWRDDSHLRPRPGARVVLTVAALRHLPGAEPLVGAFFTTIRYLIEQQRKLSPSPHKVVEATVTGSAITEQLLTASIAGSSAPPVDAIMTKLRRVLDHEPPLYSATHQPTAEADWTIRVPAVLREYRDVATIDDYLDQVCKSVTPDEPSAPMPSGPADLPAAVGYLDAVWMSRTRSHLFVNLDPTSVARLLYGCGDYLARSLEADAAERAGQALEMLLRLRHIRVSAQHADARHKAVRAFAEIRLAFPPPSWAHAWTHVSWLAKDALDSIREEVHAGLAQP